MFILPYRYRVLSHTDSCLLQFSVLTLSGTTLWKEEDQLDLVREVLAPNGIFLSGEPILRNGIYFCPVDTTKTDTSDIYQWEEIDPTEEGQFCWRTFYQCAPYGWSAPRSERLEPFSCRDVLETLTQLTHPSSSCSSSSSSHLHILNT